MGLEALKKISVPGYIVDKVQGNVDDVLRRLAGNEFITGRLFKEVALTAGKPTAVKHNLGREANWIVVRKFSAVDDIWEVSGDANKAPKSELLLDCTSDVTVNLYLF